MSNIRYWIWLSQAIGYCTTRYKQLVELYSDTDIFFEGGEPEWRLSGLFTNAEISKLNSTPLTVADEIISKCNKHCFEILPIDSPYYPKCLYNIDNPPAVIYIWGALPDIDDRLSIGVVGTRKASMYGIRSAHTISYELAKCGVTIVSGGALGIDTAAHMGCLAADGVTIAVLGCGINYDYLRENRKMRSDITFRGAVVSEYPPDTEPYSFHFPQRNRIISAFSDGIFVVVDPHFYGSNRLVKDRVATLVTDYKDILDEFDNLYVSEEIAPELSATNERVKVIPIKGKAPDNINGLKTDDLSELPVHKENLGLSEDESAVYYAIGNEPVHIDKIAEITALPIFKISSILTMLEIKKLIKSTQGRSYVLI